MRRLIRNLRLAHERLQETANKITVYEDCAECGSRVAFEFLDVPLRQTAYTNCWKCGEQLRLVKTIQEIKPSE